MIFRAYDHLASSTHYYFISEILAYKQPEKFTVGGSLRIVDVMLQGSVIARDLNLAYFIEVSIGSLSYTLPNLNFSEQISITKSYLENQYQYDYIYQGAGKRPRQ